MAKRFTDSLKWKDGWYAELSNDNRIIWQWLLDNCDHAGILKKNMRSLNFDCNTQITESALEEIFAGRILSFDGFYFLPKFLKFQYESGLNSDKPVIKSVRDQLINKNLAIIVTELYGNDYLMIDESLRIKTRIKIKEKEKEKSKDEDTEKVDAPQFEKVVVEEVTGETGKVLRFVPPTDGEIVTEFNLRTKNKFASSELPNKFAGVFIAHYTNTEWTYGKQRRKMKDWRAAMTSAWKLDQWIKENTYNERNGKSETSGERAADFARATGSRSIFDAKPYS